MTIIDCRLPSDSRQPLGGLPPCSNEPLTQLDDGYLWRRVREDGDPEALALLNQSIQPIDDQELGWGE